MTFDELLEQGRRVARTPADLQEQLQSLVQDPRSAALLGWLDQRKDGYVDAGSAQNLAPHHGALAHCQGSVFAYLEILNELRAVYESTRKSRKMRAES